MERVFKKLVATALAMLMLVSMCNIGLTALAWDEEFDVVSIYVEPLELMEGVDGYHQDSYFVYEWWEYMSPTVTLANGDVIEGEGIYLYYNDWYRYLKWEWNQDESWQAGRSYDCTVSYDDVSYTFKTTIIPSPIVSFEVEPVTVYEGLDSSEDWYYDENDDCVYYTWYNWDEVTCIATLNDGSTVEVDDYFGFEYNGNWYYPSTSDKQGLHEQWEVGGTYAGTVTLMGKTATASITVAENPVASVTAEPIEMVEGNTEYDDWSECDYYEWWYDLVYSVTFKDGTVAYADYYYDDIEFDGQYYSVSSHRDDQTSENRWTLGNTYTGFFTILGFEAEVPVTIVPSPVVSIEVEPINVYEGLDMWEDWYYDDDYNEVWYTTYEWDGASCKVTFNDGTVINTSVGAYCYHNGESYHVSYSDNQGPNGEEWQVGGTYTGTVQVGGKTASASITVKENPVAYVTAAPVSMIEGDTGYSWMYDIECYNWWYDVEYTVTFKDGTQQQGDYYNYIKFNGKYYDMSYRDNQTEYALWTVGNTYTGVISVMGVEAEVPVTIVENPVASLTVKPLTYAEGSSGSSSGYNEDSGEWEYYDYYYWYRDMEYTLTLKDGTVINGSGTDGVEIYGGYYGFVYEDDQNYETRWLPGNTYRETVSILGVEAEVYVTIVTPQTADGFAYIIEDGEAYISDCDKQAAYLEIPSEIDGYPVVAVTGLGDAMAYAERLVIPDSVTKISSRIFGGYYSGYPLQKLTIGSGITTLEPYIFNRTPYLNEITVSPNNPSYCSVDGVVYDKAVTKMILYPRARTTTHTVPQTVTDVQAFVSAVRGIGGASITFHDGVKGYKQVDGVVYNADMTEVLAVNANKTGDYVMPDSVTSIAYSSFANCNLESITISDNVTNIAYFTFGGSKNLKSVKLPANLKTIGYGAFQGCESLATVDVPAGLKSIEYKAFCGCDSLTSISLPEGLETLGADAFYSAGLTSVTIPSTVKRIDDYAFAHSALKTVTLKEGLQTIRWGAFAHTPLTAVTIPNSVTNLWGEAFSGTASLQSVTFGTGISYIPERCFVGSGLTTISFPDHIQTINPSAFENSSLKDVTLSDSVTAITYRSFRFSKDLLNIDIGENVTSLCGEAFDGTAWLDSQPNGPVYLEHVLYGYKGDAGSNTAVNIKDGTRVIADYAFEHIGAIGSLHIPASLEYIGDAAFYYCWTDNLTVDANNPYFYVKDGALYDRNDALVWNAANKPTAMTIVGDAQTEFVLGETVWDYQLPRVQLQFADGTSTVRASIVWLRGFDTSTPGKKTVTLKLGDLTASYEIVVNDTSVRSLWVNGKTHYKLGEPLALTLDAYFYDGTYQYDVTDFTVSGYDPYTVGEQEITLSYGGASITETVYVDGSMTYHADHATDIVVSAPAGTLSTNAQVVVKKGTLSDVPALDKTLTANKAVEVFDITLKENGVKVQPDGKVQVAIPVPPTMKGVFCTVYHIGADGTVTDMRAQYRDGCLVFDTDSFSYYVLVGDKDALMGDLNNDGTINIADATMLFRAVNGRVMLTAAQEAVADVNHDGAINIADATMLFRFVNGRITTLG